MLSWGNKSVVIGEFTNSMEEACGICSKKEQRRYYGEQSYFLLYGLPLAATKKTYYTACNHCNARLKLRQTDPMYPTVEREIPSGFSLRYWWGWGVIAVAAIGVWQLALSIRT